MDTPEIFYESLSKGIITYEMLDLALFSLNKRAKNYRDQKRKAKKSLGVTAWVLRNFVEWRYLTAMFRTFERLMGTKDFMRIISSAARANPMTPRLSRARMGS